MKTQIELPPVPPRFRLTSCTVVLRKGSEKFATVNEAFGRIWKAIAFGQSIEIFDRSFGV